MLVTARTFGVPTWCVKTRRWECDRPGVEPTSCGCIVWGQYHSSEKVSCDKWYWNPSPHISGYMCGARCIVWGQYHSSEKVSCDKWYWNPSPHISGYMCGARRVVRGLCCSQHTPPMDVPMNDPDTWHLLSTVPVDQVLDHPGSHARMLVDSRAPGLVPGSPGCIDPRCRYHVKTRRWECDRRECDRPGVEPTSCGCIVWEQYHSSEKVSCDKWYWNPSPHISGYMCGARRVVRGLCCSQHGVWCGVEHLPLPLPPPPPPPPP